MAIVDTILTSALSGLISKSLGFVSSAILANDDRADLDLWSVSIEDDFGEVVGILTSDQTQDLAKFLDSIEVSAILQTHFMSRLAREEQKDIDDLNTVLRDAFAKLADKWCMENGHNWKSLAEDVWDGIASRMESVLPAYKVLEELPPDEIKIFREQMEAEGAAGKVRKGVPRFLRDLLAMSTNLDRVVAARDAVADLRKGLKEYYAQIRLDHARHDFRIQMDSLYVDRRLVKRGSTEWLETAGIINSSDKIRMVVTGDPGIGKSTFTEYLVKGLSEGCEGHLAPLILNCKEYIFGGERGILDIIRGSLETSLQLSFSENELEDVLTLGWGFVILDGVDEILDLSLRRKFIRAAEALARRFPMCSIVATSRNVGYQDAQFDPTRFIRYELESFTDTEIVEYSRKWFSVTGRPESHLHRFLIELDSIPDLRGNPLLLSLLCILYRDRGHIPRNRRQIYSQCADLLFNRWDPMRDIEQPFDHQHYGEELMQEIAQWFYKSQTAQAGVEEQQLKRIISGFLKDVAAVAPVTADRRAESFLEYCADRAWLLGATGANERGQRLFVFTHRTFMEFFAAEYLARTLDIDKIIVEVADVYDRDASSVLPDLMIQSAEFHRRGGARQIISGLLGKGGILGGRKLDRYLPLCLRIVNLSPVYPGLIDDIFERTILSWDGYAPWESMNSMICILELYRDPRNRFMERLWKDADCMFDGPCREHPSHAMEKFLIRWANLYTTDLCNPYDEEWGDLVREAVSRTVGHLFAVDNIVLRDFLVEMEYTDPAKDPQDSLALQVSKNRSVVGSSFRSIERTLQGLSPKGHDETVVGKLASQALKGRKVGFPVAYRLDNALRDRLSHISLGSQAIEDQEIKTLLVWLGCAIFEATSGSINPFHDDIGSLCKVNYASLCSTRIFNLDKQGRLEDDEFEELSGPELDEAIERRYGVVMDDSQLAAVLVGFPPWVKRWSQAKKDLVEIPIADNTV